jgi:PTH1 family peptidyl-tRNA hydrolase
MKLIVGLGNPGEKYEGTRHNFGFLVADQFVKDYSSIPPISWSSNNKLKSEVALIDWQPKAGELERVILAKPQTYMNNSGMAVNLLVSYYKVKPEDLWVVYDELDLPVGTMKIRFGGAAAGHHGVESIIEKLSTDKFWRFRLGIGSFHQAGRLSREEGREHTVGRHNFSDAEEYVLGQFTGHDKGKVRELLKHGSQALQMALEKGIEASMNRYNTK